MSYENPRINSLSMTRLQVVFAMANANPVAIHGDRIWMLYSDVCGRDLVKFCAILRAYQLGQLAGVTEVAITHAIDNYGDGLDLDEILAAVRERLPNFAPAAADVPTIDQAEKAVANGS